MGGLIKITVRGRGKAHRAFRDMAAKVSWSCPFGLLMPKLAERSGKALHIRLRWVGQGELRQLIQDDVMAQQHHPPGPPMDLANMRRQGVQHSVSIVSPCRPAR